MMNRSTGWQVIGACALRFTGHFAGCVAAPFATAVVTGLVAVASTTSALAATADEAAIRALTVSWAKAYNGGDAAGVAAQYADDAVLLPPGAPAAKGKAAIMAFFTKDIATSKSAGVVLKLTAETDVGVSGNMGWESGTYAAVINGAVVDSGKFLSVSRKSNGKWRYIRDTWNADTPPAPAAPPNATPATPAAAPAAAIKK